MANETSAEKTAVRMAYSKFMRTTSFQRRRKAMADMRLLKAKLKYSDLTYQTAGEIVGVGRDTFSRKMQGDGAGFTVEEVRKLRDAMQLSKEDIWNIFFAIC